MDEDYKVYEELPWELQESETAYGDDEIPSAWCVLVEYTNPAGRGSAADRGAPTVIHYEETDLASREDAERAARRVAFEYSPPDPWSEVGRQVFELDDGYLSILQGRLSTFHFRTFVGRFLGEG